MFRRRTFLFLRLKPGQKKLLYIRQHAFNRFSWFAATFRLSSHQLTSGLKRQTLVDARPAERCPRLPKLRARSVLTSASLQLVRQKSPAKTNRAAMKLRAAPTAPVGRVQYPAGRPAKAESPTLLTKISTQNKKREIANPQEGCVCLIKRILFVMHSKSYCITP